jgi:uncharacterized repeat protein (TIGR03803 family)
MRGKKLSIGLRATLVALGVVLFVTGTAASQEVVLHSFHARDGANPYGGLIFDGSGNLYGTTVVGGAYGYGAVFELTPAAGGRWTEKVLYDFSDNSSDGNHPQAGLVFDAAGNLYGTTGYGGSGACSNGTAVGCGTVFELSPQLGGDWKEKLLHSFDNNGTDGNYPVASLIFDADGNIYGTTQYGGAYDDGTAFELTPTGGSWTETVLHTFSPNGGDGEIPYAGLVFDAAGNLYGTTVYGGAYLFGTVFELTPAVGGTWTETVLHDFNNNGSDGTDPEASLILDSYGNLYGTTVTGGGPYSGGTVFQLIPTVGGTWKERLLHSFGNGRDGIYPTASLMFDASGNLYGTTFGGGAYYNGTVFELSPILGVGWVEKPLHAFVGSARDGVGPFASVVFDASGNLCGTTTSGGGAYDVGTVFEITP